MPKGTALNGRKNDEMNKYLRGLVKDNPESTPTELAHLAISKYKNLLSFAALRLRIYRIKEEQASAVEVDENNDPVREQLISHIKLGKAKTIVELADTLDVSPKTISESLELLAVEGYDVEIMKGIIPDRAASTPPPEPFRKISIDNYVEGKWQKFGVVSDTHLCSKQERLDVLHTMYDLFEAEGIDTVYLPGNYIDGVTTFNMFELKTPVGFDKQMDYFLEQFPHKPNIKTYFIDADEHEGWYFKREGIIPGRHLENMAKGVGRDDLVYLGYLESDVSYLTPEGRTIVRLFHPKRGTAYAVSYSAQKIVESYQGGEKPDILIVGHFHKAEYMPHYRNIHVIQAACCQDQTVFMRGKSIEAHVGGWIVRFKQRPLGSVCRLQAEFVGFYDRAYHIKHEFSEEEV